MTQDTEIVIRKLMNNLDHLVSVAKMELEIATKRREAAEAESAIMLARMKAATESLKSWQAERYRR